MNKIVVMDGYTTNPGDLSWNPFEAYGELEVYDRTLPSDVLARIGDASIVLTNKTQFPRSTLERMPNLKYLGAMSTGYNVIDVEAARDLGITVTNIPEYATFATAQMTIALLLELTNRVGRHDRLVHEGGWARSVDFCFTDGPLTELWQKTMGLVGYGKIGKRVAAIAQALGMKVLVTSRSIEKRMQAGEISSEEAAVDGTYYADFDTLLKNSDIISFHCPLTPETTGLVNQNTISKMKDGVLLINTSRGPVFEEHDVAQALGTGKIAGAAVDVLSAEPADEKNPLLTAPNCIITPHIAWAPKETRQRLMDTAYENLSSYLSGNPQNVV